MGVRNGKRKTGKRRFVQTKRSPFSSKSLLNLSLSLDSARASPHPQRRRARHREREREKGETERFATRKKKVPRSFSRAVMVPRAFVPKREISNVVEHLKERRRMVEAGEKRTLSHDDDDDDDDAPKTRSSRLSSTTPAWRGCRKTNRTATCFDMWWSQSFAVQPKRK